MEASLPLSNLRYSFLKLFFYESMWLNISIKKQSKLLPLTHGKR